MLNDFVKPARPVPRLRLDGFVQDGRRPGERHHFQNDLVSEKSRAHSDEEHVDSFKKPRNAPRKSQHAKRKRNGNLALHQKSGLLKQVPERVDRKEALVRHIQNASVSIVEMPEKKHQPDGEKSHVPSAADEPGGVFVWKRGELQ